MYPYDFKKDATFLIEDIKKRGKTPILVGGTGLYITSLLYDYKMDEEMNKNFNDESEEIDNIIVLNDENGEEVEIRENVEPPTNNYRFEMEGETRNYDYERDDMASYGYQKQEFNEDGEITDVYEEPDEDAYADDFADDVDFGDTFEDDDEN